MTANGRRIFRVDTQRFPHDRLATGETELHKLANDPNEFNNLNEPEYAPLIEQLEKHLSFSYPEIPDGWIGQADSRTDFGDRRLRGNCHYPLADGASGRFSALCVRCGQLHGLLTPPPPNAARGHHRLGATCRAG